MMDMTSINVTSKIIAALGTESLTSNLPSSISSPRIKRPDTPGELFPGGPSNERCGLQVLLSV